MTKIYYFSATGNSLWSARRIAQIIKDSGQEACELIHMGKELQKSEIIAEADAVILVFPSFAYNPPLAVKKFVKRAEFKTQYFASFVTFGSSPLGTNGKLKRLLKKKLNCKMFFGKIPAVENYLAMFGTPTKETIELRTGMQKKATEEAAQNIIERKENDVRTFTPFSSFISLLFILGTKIFYRFYQVSKTCNGCAVCEKICPVSVIKIKNGRPVFHYGCECCQACVNICPSRAIQFTRVRYGTPGYCHPEIQIKDLM